MLGVIVYLCIGLLLSGIALVQMYKTGYKGLEDPDSRKGVTIAAVITLFAWPVTLIIGIKYLNK